MSSRPLFWDVWHGYWYQYYPTAVVLRDAKNDRSECLDELVRRVRLGKVAPRHADEVAEVALDKHGRWPQGVRPRAWARILESLNDQGLLTSKQSDQFFGKFATPSLRVRPVIRQGDPLVVRLDYQSSRSGLYAYRFWHDPVELRVGGELVHRGVQDAWRQREPDWRRSNASPAIAKTIVVPAPNLLAGTWTVDFLGRQVFLRPWGYRTRASPSWTKDTHLSGLVEVLPADTPDPIAWIDEPGLTHELQQLFHVDVLDYGLTERESHPRDWAHGEVLSVDIGLWTSPPVPVAFELVVHAQGRDLPTDFFFLSAYDRYTDSRLFAWSKTERGIVFGEAWTPRFEANEVFLILRASRDVARQTVDLKAIWKGELRFGPFRLEEPSPIPPGPRPAP